MIRLRQPPGVKSSQRRNMTVFRTPTFPSLHVPGANPIEVVLLGRIGHGGGTALVEQMKQRQARHSRFVDEMEEPSSQLFNTALSKEEEYQDKTAVYSFSVDRQHPFHRHAGHRVFTAISGSGGCYLRFSTATNQDLDISPTSFFQKMKEVHIPGDSLFTLRFDGRVWHQFSSAVKRQPAFFAISVHTDETGGDLSLEVQNKVKSGDASIALLTELLPPHVQNMTDDKQNYANVLRYSLSLESGGPNRIRDWGCLNYRTLMGMVKTYTSLTFRNLIGGDGYAQHPKVQLPSPSFVHAIASSDTVHVADVVSVPVDNDSLLHGEFRDRHDHMDSFSITIGSPHATRNRVTSNDRSGLHLKFDETFRRQLMDGACDADDVLERVLTAFVDHPPQDVGTWMELRNKMVRPLSLRTSPLACPVSSLLGPTNSNTFGRKRRFPVRGIKRCVSGLSTEVLLGANDKHLQFRSTVSVTLIPREDTAEGKREIGAVQIKLSDKIRTENVFGKFYIGAIEGVHKKVIAPRLLTHTACTVFEKEMN
ncbi:hypothetical protein PROFUN_05211 [Planoprotostelium fungivorum]|uniref:Uncharacterized protein n=1 Tax=Planoprotostelium fungivorum TaxID=1890364 RepID=A0A2P6NRI1_9EUKA|nr:hypothetical protein PROFUN_05211 [Planoprotostelium fungivorum]